MVRQPLKYYENKKEGTFLVSYKGRRL